jgi:putative beta-lysine N-acetyltransferase
MNDVVLHRGNSIIQHGHHNQRVYVMHLSPSEIPEIIRYADELCAREGYSKIFVKVPESSVELFSDNGYVTEATVPFFYRGNESTVFMAKYRDPERSKVRDAAVMGEVLSEAFGLSGGTVSQRPLPPGFSLMPAHARDAPEIAALYRAVFETYPFPVVDPAYIQETMKGSIRYFIVRSSHQLAAVASCEVNEEDRNAEMTDFATSPEFQKRGLARNLLHAMEILMQKEGILLAYTIARAVSRPINAMFAAAGYQFGGMLPNNTNICGSLESMNVWYKRL